MSSKLKGPEWKFLDICPSVDLNPGSLDPAKIEHSDKKNCCVHKCHYHIIILKEREKQTATKLKSSVLVTGLTLAGIDHFHWSLLVISSILMDQPLIVAQF